MNGRAATTEAIDDEPAKDTVFCKTLRSRVHDPEEAVFVARTHRRRAAEARGGIPAVIRSFQDDSRARHLESVARNHDEIIAACERHETRLRVAAGGAARGAA